MVRGLIVTQKGGSVKGKESFSSGHAINCDFAKTTVNGTRIFRDKQKKNP
jgi:hypothetical protein